MESSCYNHGGVRVSNFISLVVVLVVLLDVASALVADMYKKNCIQIFAIVAV